MQILNVAWVPEMLQPLPLVRCSPSPRRAVECNRTVVPLVLHHSHNALPPKMHRVWRLRSWSKGNYIGIMHNLPNCIMHEDLGHPKTEYAFWEVLIWCHNPAISSIFCIESDQMSGMNHKHSIKSPDRPNILVKCYVRHAVTLNTSCI